MLAPQSTDTFSGEIYFESTDANSKADPPAVLKKDTISLTVLDSACKPTQNMTRAYDYNTVDELEWIVEYEPKFYFPEYIWTGYHTLEGINCYGSYTQTIEMDKVASLVTIVPEGRPYMQISSEETFTLTFTGTYIALDGVTFTDSF